jgi:low temperature requirement protein LtrA
MNFTWFASAFDTDDVPYRLWTMLQMAGVLVLAAGVPAASDHFDFTVVTVGYVIMRVAMIAQWLRVSIQDPQHRSAAVRSATGIAVVPAGWLARLGSTGIWAYLSFGILVVAELAVPAWAEHRGGQTSWHPRHITERYGGFTIIVLGEVILATLVALQSGPHNASSWAVAAGGLLLVFGLWWIYFADGGVELGGLSTALAWGYGHYAVFAAIAALGAGLDSALDAVTHHSHLSPSSAVLAVLHRLTAVRTTAANAVLALGAVVVLALGFVPPSLGVAQSVLGMGVVVAVTLGVIVAVSAQSGT